MNDSQDHDKLDRWTGQHEEFMTALTERSLTGQGVLVTGPLYLVLVFVAALLGNHVLAMDLSILALGVSYFAYFTQYPSGLFENSIVPALLVFASIAVGAAAGFALLLGV